MPANNTDQASLRAIQGGSPTTRGQNQRAQRTGRASNPNTSYNNSNNNSGSNNMFSAYFGGGYNPFGMYPSMGQYGNQQSNLGRYRPPTMNGGTWSDNGGYAYNIPNAFGSTGLNYMSGFGGLPFNPFMGYSQPMGMSGPTMQGMYGYGDGSPDSSRYAAGRAANGSRGDMERMMGISPGMFNNGQQVQQLQSSMGNYTKPMEMGGPVNTPTTSTPAQNNRLRFPFGW